MFEFLTVTSFLLGLHQADKGWFKIPKCGTVLYLESLSNCIINTLYEDTFLQLYFAFHGQVGVNGQKVDPLQNSCLHKSACLLVQSYSQPLTFDDKRDHLSHGQTQTSRWGD